MKYWNDIISRFGFDDGSNIPITANLHRQVYLLAVNTFAKRKGSKVRAIAYDRPGLHNHCMILLVAADEFNPLLASGRHPLPQESPEQDVAFVDAVDSASKMGIDSYVKRRRVNWAKIEADLGLQVADKCAV